MHRTVYRKVTGGCVILRRAFGPCAHSRRRSRQPALSADPPAIEASRAHWRQVPPHRRSDQQLSSCRHPADPRSDAVQLRLTESPRQSDLSILLGADYFDDQPARNAGRPPLGIGRDVVLERVIVDKNARIGDGARLVNRAGVTHHDGAGYFIRNGIVVVPKDSTIAAGFEV